MAVRDHPSFTGENFLKSYVVVFCLLAAALLMWSGCSSEEVQQVRAASSGLAPADDAFSASVTMCRKIGSKSGRRIGAGHEFIMSEKSYVRAFVDFANVKAGRPYTVHLAWIRPDGKEMFRKYVEVRQGEAEEGEFATVINWLDAEDLHKIK